MDPSGGKEYKLRRSEPLKCEIIHNHLTQKWLNVIIGISKNRKIKKVDKNKLGY